MLKIEIKMVLNQRWIYLVKPVQPKAKRCKHVSSKENEPKDEFPGINEDSDEGIDFASEKALKGEKWDRIDESNKYEFVEVPSHSFKK